MIEHPGRPLDRRRDQRTTSRPVSDWDGPQRVAPKDCLAPDRAMQMEPTK